MSSVRELETMTIDNDDDDFDSLAPRLDPKDAVPRIRVNKSPQIVIRKAMGMSPDAKSPRNIKLKGLNHNAASLISIKPPLQ